jgi:hypothetical protein
MDFSTYALIFFGILALINVICTIILYPGLRDVVKEFKRDS